MRNYLCEPMKRLISIATRYVPRPILQRLTGTGLKAASLFYRGTAVTCPICDHSFRKFLPYGRVNPRPNALCPNCLSLERHRLIWLFLQQETPFFSKPADVLHIAPEVCFISRLDKVHGDKYITADIESPLAKVKLDIHAIPFQDNSFDYVLCNHVLEHVDNDLKAMTEIHRVLRPGGVAILQVPFFNPIPKTTLEDFSIVDPKAREVAFGQSDHVRRYGHDFPDRIRSSGLNPIVSSFAASLDESQCRQAGIVREEILYGGIKP